MTGTFLMRQFTIYQTLLVASMSTLAHGVEPYPRSDFIVGMKLDWSTHRREAQGSDNFQLTWADDNHLYGAWGDGGGFGGSNSKGRVGLGVARIEGPSVDYRGYNVWGGVNAAHSASFDGKSWGMISVKGALHMWVVPDKPHGKNYRNHYEYIELASSIDHGATWTKADWKFLQTDDLTVPTFLNFGRDHQDVPARLEGFVYSYFIRPHNQSMEHQGKDGVGLIVHKPGAIYLARVDARDLQRSRDRYEFFAGLNQRR